MKKQLIILSVFVACLSCDFDEQETFDFMQTYHVAVPLKTNLDTFKQEAFGVFEARPIVDSGKIYAYKDYVFVNDVGRGFHILDNSHPESPVNIGFIKLEGNHDISIKDDRIFADSYGDLVVLDISNIHNITQVSRLTNAIYQEFWCTVAFDIPEIDEEIDAWDYRNFNATEEAIVGWDVQEVRMRQSEFLETYGGIYETDINYVDSAESVSDNAVTGQGGSFARFKIVENYLYAVEPWSINIFDISNLDDPKVLEEVYSNGNIETIFNQGDILFLGGTQGMYIYDISDPAKPTFVSEFRHGKACDPVVVSGDYAFVTLRSGNSCGGTENGLYIVDISDLSNPSLIKTYPMTEPFGLGVKEEKLFICDGSDGLKVYDKTNVENLIALNHFTEINAYDVIPLPHSLLMIGDKVLHQYSYLDNEIRLLSTFNLN